MKSIPLDIETIPQSAEALQAAMPEEIRAPVMPPDISSPIEPDFKAKCPKYGGDETKQLKWLTEAATKWGAGITAAREKWEQSTLEAKAKFIEQAALHAETGHVKMIGLSINCEKTIYLWEPDKKLVSIAEKEATAQKVGLFAPFMLEKQMLQRFAKDFIAMMEEDAHDIRDREGNLAGRAIFNEKARVVGYYSNTFDLPFLARRAAILGDSSLMRFLRMHRRGRYLDATRFVDLHEEFVMGDRETRTGGLDGLAKTLGVDRKSQPCGGSFYKFYQENPAEGIVYLLRDLAATESCANRMGIE